MSLTKEEDAKIELVVMKAIEKFKDKNVEVIEDKIEQHEKTCKVGEEFRIMKAKMVGLLLGIGVGSAGVGGGVAAIVTKVFGS